MICGLHLVFTEVWQSGTIPRDWKRGQVILICKVKRDNWGLGLSNHSRHLSLVSPLVTRSTVNALDL